jgi:hypothetical protein
VGTGVTCSAYADGLNVCSSDLDRGISPRGVPKSDHFDSLVSVVDAINNTIRMNYDFPNQRIFKF